MNNVDIKLLNLFVVLLNERSVSNTAERLGMTQPAVSLSLSRLRELFHDPLLLRSGRRMTPTNRALQIESSVRNMLSDLIGVKWAKKFLKSMNLRWLKV